MNSIVIGYDGSESADRALERVPELVEDGAKVYLVAAIHQLAGKGGMSWDPIEKEQHEVDLEHAKARLADAGIQAEISEGLGDPATVITELAKRVKADLVVIGNDHKNLIERLLLGSVGSGVAHRADCDVLVVR
jgi:nucleotide-binding universal stress UspA family protein